ncbi:MAG: hypothetical protein KPEEDBHJ_00041 [Anaerolineales bacterium]|nr:hypothetical protein [Anaerolineales bacterium]
MKANKALRIIPLLVLMGIISFLFQSKPAGANSIPNTPDTVEIMTVIERAYELMAYAQKTFDVSEFPSVFIDTQDYELNAKQKSAISSILGMETADVEEAGYLTAMQIQYISMGQGSELLKSALEKANSENRELTAEEFQAIVQANHGQLPAPSFVLDTETKFVFESIDIDGNKAVVRYDDGAALQEAILVKMERWLIASIVPIWIHF